MGSTIPSIEPGVEVNWYIAPTPEVPSGPPAPGMEGIETPHIKEESYARGERDE